MYNRYQKSKSKNISSILKIVGLGLVTLIIFFLGLNNLRSEDKKTSGEEVGLENKVADNSSSVSNIESLATQESVIKSLASGLEIGSAVRSLEKGILYHTVKVSLPEINRETEFYEGWLVRQSPYDFFSTGEMTTNSAGEFVLEWAGEHKDVIYYDRVVITREAKDGNSAPSAHVAEGSFGGVEGE